MDRMTNALKNCEGEVKGSIIGTDLVGFRVRGGGKRVGRISGSGRVESECRRDENPRVGSPVSVPDRK